MKGVEEYHRVWPKGEVSPLAHAAITELEAWVVTYRDDLARARRELEWLGSQSFIGKLRRFFYTKRREA